MLYVWYLAHLFCSQRFLVMIPLYVGAVSCREFRHPFLRNRSRWCPDLVQIWSRFGPDFAVQTVWTNFGNHPVELLVLNQRTLFFCGQPHDPNLTMSPDTFRIPLVPPLPSTPAPLNDNTREGVLLAVASPNLATTPNRSHQRSKITVDASPKLPPPRPFSDCLPLCRRRN
jgi:hypothetical protein